MKYLHIEHLVRDINKMSLPDKISLYKKLIGENRIYYGEYYSQNFEEIMNITDKTYPEEWDLHFQGNIASESIELIEIEEEDKKIKKVKYFVSIEPTIILKFKKLTIENRLGYKKNIYDTYVRLDPYFAYKSAISGTPPLSFSHFRAIRMGATKEDIMSGFLHSHITPRSGAAYSSVLNFEFNNGMCLGFGAFKAMMNELQTKYTAVKYKMFLLSIKTYLEWESIAGRPYYYIGNITGKSVIETLTREDLVKFLKDLESNGEYVRNYVTNLNVEVKNNSITIVDDEKLEEFLKIYGEDTNEYRQVYLVERDNKGENYAFRKFPDKFPSDLLLSEKDRERIGFYFRGEKVPFRIVEEEELNNRVFYIHPKIKYYVKRKIEQRSQKERLRKGVLKTLNTTASARKPIKEDTISMQ